MTYFKKMYNFKLEILLDDKTNKYVSMISNFKCNNVYFKPNAGNFVHD